MKWPTTRRFTANVFFPAAPPRRLAGWRRRLDAVLRRLGPSWRAAPARRLVQVACLGLFLHLFFPVAWPYTALVAHTSPSAREPVPLELFLWLDPLVGLSTAIAARAWNVALIGTVAILLAGALVPRGFCGYLCPFGTLIDGFDWLVGRRVRRFRVAEVGRWAHLRYYVLAAVLAGSALGVLLSGCVAAIPVVTRGLMFTLGRLELGLRKDWSQLGPVGWTFYLSIALFAAIFLLGLLHERFWCRYVCPSGALLSVFNLLRATERKVEASCIHCGKCVEACPFDAIREDFTTRTPECTFCQTCGGVCPVHSIQFVSRRDRQNLKPEGDVPVLPRPISRRALFASVAAGAVGAVATRPGLSDPPAAGPKLIRPPGSVPEGEFLDLCIRCGECFKVCPGPVLHPAGIEAGWEALWTPAAVMTHAGCHQECNFCTQVCPTGAIRPLSLAEKRRARMGLAVVDAKTCLPHRGERDCRLCFDECEAAGYHAIVMEDVELEVGEIPEGAFSEVEVEAMRHIAAPRVDAEACVGCGLCEYRCHAALVKQEKVLRRSAVVVVP